MLEGRLDLFGTADCQQHYADRQHPGHNPNREPKKTGALQELGDLVEQQTMSTVERKKQEEVTKMKLQGLTELHDWMQS